MSVYTNLNVHIYVFESYVFESYKWVFILM